MWTNKRLALHMGVETVGIRLDAMGRRKRFTLMPAIALVALGLMIALPSLSSVRLYAATAPTYVTVTVRPGDTIWSIAASHDRSNPIYKNSSTGSATQTAFRAARCSPVSIYAYPSKRHRLVEFPG
jgi:hypothetical protein